MKQKLRQFARMRNRYILGIDFIILALSPALAFYLRTESLQDLARLAVALSIFAGTMVALKIAIFFLLNLYQEYWPYASTDALLTLIKSSAAAFVGEIFFFYAVFLPLGLFPPDFPRSMPIIDSFISLMGIGAVRLSIRMVFSFYKSHTTRTTFKPVLIAGAGVAGAMTARELQTNKQLGLMPAGFVDDDPLKQGRRIHGVPVLGPTKDLPRILREMKISEVVVAMPMAPGRVVREVLQACRMAGVNTKTIPGIFEILRGSAKVDQIRNIQLEDLLRRGAVKTDTGEVARLLRGETILVTGAGGSIGSELCRQIKEFGPATLILLGHGENSIFEVAAELNEVPRRDMKLHRVIADIRDRDRMEQVFEKYRPTIVFHAAAHKHVPLMEENIVEAVSNNILGTKNLIDLSEKYSVKRFVLISSDKAVNPTSYMGATKRVAELIVQEISCSRKKPFVAVRFGNVLGSRGSVVPFFKRQIELGGPVTVTDPNVRRYFMTIPEAVQLVLQAGSMGRGCEVFVLDMGEQIPVVDLARDMIRLSGLEEGRDIEIKFTGLRPGEKMFEELFLDAEIKEKTDHDKIIVCRNGFPAFMRGRKASKQDEPLRVEIDTLIEAAGQGSMDVVDRILTKLVPEFKPMCKEGGGQAHPPLSVRRVPPPEVFVGNEIH
jgi:FlaA1/EpsC-like NDP-sugar epimerase